MELKLGDVQTTALIPLCIKANETLRNNARIKDDKAVEIVKTIGIDTEPYDKFMSHEGVIARTIMLDKMLSDLISKNPNLAVVNIGAGLDNRFTRVDNGQILWIDLDLPDTMAVRRKAFDERERNILIDGSALDDKWCNDVKDVIKDRDTVFIAEGLLMYFSPDEVRTFLTVLKQNFSKGYLFAELNNPMMVKNQKNHDTVKNTNAEFKYGSKSAQETADLVPGIQVVGEHSFNEEMRKYSIRAKLFALLLPGMNNRWGIFKWE